MNNQRVHFRRRSTSYSTRKFHSRQFHMEALENRQLMASDFHSGPIEPEVLWDPPLGETPPNVETGPTCPLNPNGPEPYRLWERGPDGELYPLGEGPFGSVPLGSGPNVESGPTSPFNPNGPEPYRLWERGPDGELYPLGEGPAGSVPLGSQPDMESALPEPYESMRQALGDNELAEMLRNNKRRWGNHQGICGTGLMEMQRHYPDSWRQFLETERQLEEWLNGQRVPQDQRGSGSNGSSGQGQSDNATLPQDGSTTPLPGAVGGTLAASPQPFGVHVGRTPPGPGLADVFRYPQNYLPDGGAWVKVGENQWRYYTRHALEHMQLTVRNASITDNGVGPQMTRHATIAGNPPAEMRGIPRSVVEQAIQHGEAYQGFDSGGGKTTVHFDPENNVSVRLNSRGDVVTVQRGQMPEVGKAPKIPRSQLGGIMRGGVSAAAGFVLAEVANWLGSNFGQGLGQTEVEPGVTVHDWWGDRIHELLGDDVLLGMGDVIDFIDDVLDDVNEFLEPSQDMIADAINAIVPDSALIWIDDVITDGAQAVQNAGQATGGAIVDTVNASVQIAEENGGGVTGYLKGVAKWWGDALAGRYIVLHDPRARSARVS